MSKHPVVRVVDLPPGQRLIVDVRGKPVRIFNVGGKFFALRNRCPHQGAELCRGPIVATLTSSAPGEYEYNADETLLQCPWHGWEFDLSTGRSWFDPDKTRAKAYSVSVERRDLPDFLGPKGRAPGPFLAETYSVVVEDEYVVIDLSSPATQAPS